MTAASDAWTLAFGDLSLTEAFGLRTSPEARFFPGDDAARFLPLCRPADLDAFLATDAARTPRVILTDARRPGGAGVPYGEFVFDGGNRIDLPRLQALHDRGATVVLSQMDEVLAPIGRFCRGLERVFLHPVQCNIYLTPPGAQGFRPHYDAHDVLILQVQGEKLWRVWPTPVSPFANPLTRWDARDERPLPAETPVTQTIRPGDALYVPRGMLHEAPAQGGESSLHLTVGLLGHSWGEALRTALNVLERQDPALRQAFPTWLLADGAVSGALAEEASGRLSALGALRTIELASQQLLTQLAQSRAPMLGRGLAGPVVSADDRLVLCDTVHHFVVPLADGRAELRWAGGALALSPAQFQWLAALAEGASARDLGDADALAFCQRLATLGLAVIEPAAPR